jgi:hypothetical protein
MHWRDKICHVGRRFQRGKSRRVTPVGVTDIVLSRHWKWRDKTQP